MYGLKMDSLLSPCLACYIAVQCDGYAAGGCVRGLGDRRLGATQSADRATKALPETVLNLPFSILLLVTILGTSSLGVEVVIPVVLASARMLIKLVTVARMQRKTDLSVAQSII